MATDKLVDFDHVTDYISREAAKQIICEACERPGCPELWGYSCDRTDRLNAIPAADVRPVVRARWKAHGDCGVTECPVCMWTIEECVDYNFCPNCGAEMKPNLDTTKGEKRGIHCLIEILEGDSDDA